MKQYQDVSARLMVLVDRSRNYPDSEQKSSHIPELIAALAVTTEAKARVSNIINRRDPAIPNLMRLVGELAVDGGKAPETLAHQLKSLKQWINQGLSGTMESRSGNIKADYERLRMHDLKLAEGVLADDVQFREEIAALPKTPEDDAVLDDRQARNLAQRIFLGVHNLIVLSRTYAKPEVTYTQANLGRAPMVRQDPFRLCQAGKPFSSHRHRS